MEKLFGRFFPATNISDLVFFSLYFNVRCLYAHVQNVIIPDTLTLMHITFCSLNALFL